MAPEQWSFPLRLPLSFFGINRSVAIRAGETYPWSRDLDHRVLTVNISKGAALHLPDTPRTCACAPPRYMGGRGHAFSPAHLQHPLKQMADG